MKETSHTDSFYPPDDLREQIHRLIGFSDKSEKSKSECYVDFFKKLLLNNSLPQASDTIHSDVTTETDSLQERAKSNPDLRQALDKVKDEGDKSLHPPPPCHFVSKGYLDPKLKLQFVYCDSPSRKGKKKDPVPVPLSVCQQHWERKEFVKEKREQQEPTKPETAPTPKPPPKPYKKTLIEKIDDGTLEYECYYGIITNKYLMKDLPCLIDHSFHCPNKTCDQRLTRLCEDSNERNDPFYATHPHIKLNPQGESDAQN